MTKKVAAKTTRGTNGSSLNRRPNGKRSRRSREDQRSKSRSSKKIRKNIQRHDSFSLPSVSLTPNAIESMVTGVELLDRRDDSFESPSKPAAKKMDDSSTCPTELILRLRLDLPSETKTDGQKQPASLDNMEDQPALFGTLGDGKSSIRVMLLNPDGLWSRRLIPEKLLSCEEQEKGPKDWIVKVHGYATTEKFWHLKYQIYPILCLASISILETVGCEKKKSSKSALGKPLFTNSVGDSGFSPATMNFKAQAGTIGKFLKERGPFLTNEELAGSSGAVDQWFDATTTATTTTTTATTSNEDDGLECAASTPLSRSQNYKKVHECLSRHSAMLTLQQSSSSPPSSPTNSVSENPTSSSPEGENDASAIQAPPPAPPAPPASPLKSKRPTQHAWELYDGALREFKTSQMDRQKASLGTNVGRESAERAELVVEQHKIALELALKEEGPLTVELLVSTTSTGVV